MPPVSVLCVCVNVCVCVCVCAYTAYTYTRNIEHTRRTCTRCMARQGSLCWHAFVESEGRGRAEPSSALDVCGMMLPARRATPTHTTRTHTDTHRILAARRATTFLYVCMYVCMHACIYVCMCVCMHVCICMHACMHACMRVCVCICMLACMHVCT